MTHRSLWLGLLIVAVTLAPAPQNPPPLAQVPVPPANPSKLGQLRVQAGVKAYDLAWLYYTENRIDSEKVYRWSRRLLGAEREAAVDQAGQVAACQRHLDRIKLLETKIRRIRRIGFGDSLDVIEVDYYRKEADFWMANARDAK